MLVQGVPDARPPPLGAKCGPTPSLHPALQRRYFSIVTPGAKVLFIACEFYYFEVLNNAADYHPMFSWSAHVCLFFDFPLVSVLLLCCMNQSAGTFFCEVPYFSSLKPFRPKACPPRLSLVHPFVLRARWLSNGRRIDQYVLYLVLCWNAIRTFTVGTQWLATSPRILPTYVWIRTNVEVSVIRSWLILEVGFRW